MNHFTLVDWVDFVRQLKDLAATALATAFGRDLPGVLDSRPHVASPPRLWI